MKIDFWKDYDGKNGDDIPPLRVNVIKHSFHYSTWEYTGLEMVRIKAYAKACGIDLKTTPINAEFMNTMEEWYLTLAEIWGKMQKKYTNKILYGEEDKT